MTGYSPFEILFGNAPRFPIDIALNLKMNNISVGDNDVEQYRRALNFHLQSIYSKLNQTQDMYDLRRKRSFDEGRTDVRYCVGDHVTLWDGNTKVGIKKKITQKWTGIWEIVQIVGTNAVHVKNLITNKQKTRNMDNIKHVHWHVDQVV